ncbi:MAG: DNA mismatch endonuclease Vsr [bacterium]
MDTLTPEQRSRTMARVRGKDTGPEMRVRRLVHGMRYRYRLHRSDLPGKPDLVFPRLGKTIFVHGCFWHVHNCPAGRKRVRTNEDYWLPKLARTKKRDRKNLAALRKQGWEVLVLWECQLKDEGVLRKAIRKFLGSRR